MTLAVAIKATDSIIVSADSRGTIGDPRGLTAVNDTMQKVFEFGKCALAIAGQSELALVLLDEFQRRGLNNPQNVDDALTAFPQAATMCDQWYGGAIPPEKRPSVMFILAGYRDPGGVPTPQVYSLASTTNFAPQLAGNYPTMAGVPQYATYLSHRYYDPGMRGEKAAALAEYLISETASQDPKVGGPVCIAEVTAQRVRKLSTDEIVFLQRSNRTINARLKRFFMQ